MHFLLKIAHFTSRTPGSSGGTISLLQDLRTPKHGYATACCLGAPTNATLIRFWLFVASCWGLASLERGNPHTLLAILSICWKLRMFRHCNCHTLSYLLTSCWKLGMLRKCNPHTFSAPRTAQEPPGAFRRAESSSRKARESPSPGDPKRAQELPKCIF